MTKINLLKKTLYSTEKYDNPLLKNMIKKYKNKINKKCNNENI